MQLENMEYEDDFDEEIEDSIERSAIGAAEANKQASNILKQVSIKSPV